MKIALIGYGKMGKIIEEIALSRGHEITEKIDINLPGSYDSEGFKAADVVIEFTAPSVAYDNYMKCFERHKAVVSGTTGWLDKLPKIKEMCADGKATFFYSSNFSLGVNIFFEINRQLARLMNKFDAYKPSMTETHHIHKLDAPSGTAKTLAEDIERFKLQVSGTKLQVPIESIREGEVPGIHTVTWDSPVDTISITHSAKSREGFALGAVLAAEWLKGKTGWHTMEEVLDY